MEPSLTAPVALFALPRHHLSPDSVTLNGLFEGGADDKKSSGSFDMLHRAIDDPGAPELPVELVIPPGFEAETIATRTGRVNGAPEYSYKDTTYRVTLKDRSLGLHRANIALRDPDGKDILTAPVVWDRLPFLSSIPKRAVLSARPVRVFLRCPEQQVELARVLSAPAGVKAVLNSPREVALMLTEEAPGVIDGVVEVETTAEGHPPLRIPVARYAPLADRR